jgi:tRNA (guanine-N7-)-methyltransferase
MTENNFPRRRVQSFVRRDGRMTDGQKHALETLLPSLGLLLQDGIINLTDIFQRDAKCVLEIGFGSGYSLLEMAKACPEQNFIGIETHLPGIGTLLQGIAVLQLKNIRVYYADAVEVLGQCIPDQSLDVVQLFFPDPWPKRKHHKRRLIQETFVNLLIKKLKPGGTLHLATDWEHYAVHMMKVLSAIPALSNLAGERQYANRSTQRPIITKFEERGRQSGRAIWELQFERCI